MRYAVSKHSRLPSASAVFRKSDIKLGKHVDASLLEFQETGLVPSVCADDGSFQQNAADCYACGSQGNGGNGFSSAFANEPHGAAFIAVFRYCAGIKPTVLPVTVLMTTTIGSVQQVFSITTNITMGTPTQTTMASTTSSLLEPPSTLRPLNSYLTLAY